MLNKGQILGALMDHNVGDNHSHDYDSDDSDDLDEEFLKEAPLDTSLNGEADA